jgi:hypothetical protein
MGQGRDTFIGFGNHTIFGSENNRETLQLPRGRYGEGALDGRRRDRSDLFAQQFGAYGDALAIIEGAGGDALEIGLHRIEGPITLLALNGHAQGLLSEPWFQRIALLEIGLSMNGHGSPDVADDCQRMANALGAQAG